MVNNKLDLSSLDIAADRTGKLKQLFPEVFREGKVDFDHLREVLDVVDNRKERYGLTWAGKGDAIQNIQVPSVGTLLPVPEQSVNFDSTGNAVIEGDNLEVLKLLQKSYYGKIKMIYIDPPYNTGNEFIYPDNFREGLEEYLRFSGQTDEYGIKLSTNAETNGRYHSNWLNMMYPRLFLARNLLKEDGVIFVSIDDHEVANLKLLMNEIFGEEQFIGSFVWKRRQIVDSRAKSGVSQDHEYVLCYGKRDGSRIRGQDKDLTKYSNPDNDPRGPWMSDNMVGLATKEQRPNLHYELSDPTTGIVYACPPTGWRYEPKRMAVLIQNGEVLFPKNQEGRPRRKKFQKDLESDFTGFSTILDTVYNTQATREVREIFDGYELFDFPKPVDLLKLLIQQGTVEAENDIVLDFFAGSGSTAQAVLELNRQDGGNRKFILVQLPEPTDRQEYPTIAEITKERVRRVIAKLNQEEENELDLGDAQTKDRGFKVFKLSSSNFKIWDGSTEKITNAQILSEQLTMFADNVQPNRSKQDMLYEILLKSGFQLSEPIDPVLVYGEIIYSVSEGSLLICLADMVTEELVRGMIDQNPDSVICLDSAFHGNDPLKTNTVLEMKSHDVEFRTV